MADDHLCSASTSLILSGTRKQALLGQGYIWCPTARLLPQTQRQMGLQQSTARVVYFILGLGQLQTTWAWKLMKGEEPSLSSPVRDITQLAGNQAKWIWFQTPRFSRQCQQTHLEAFFFPLGLRMIKPIHDEHFLNNVIPYVNVLFV